MNRPTLVDLIDEMEHMIREERSQTHRWKPLRWIGLSLEYISKTTSLMRTDNEIEELFREARLFAEEVPKAQHDNDGQS